jgi:CCR4-NOT transcription complex subunit 1
MSRGVHGVPQQRPTQPFWDPTMPVMHYQSSLPDPLRIKPSGLLTQQTRVYDDFSQPRRVEQKRVLMPRAASYGRQDMMSAGGGSSNFSNPSPAPSAQSQGQGQPSPSVMVPERAMERFVVRLVWS